MTQKQQQQKLSNIYIPLHTNVTHSISMSSSDTCSDSFGKYYNHYTGAIVDCMVNGKLISNLLKDSSFQFSCTVTIGNLVYNNLYLFPCQIFHFLIMCKLKISNPF